MFPSDIRGLDPRHSTRHAPGGVAPSRYELGKHRYLESKRARLDAEAAERRRIATGRAVATAGAWLRRLLKTIRDRVRVVGIRRGAKGA